MSRVRSREREWGGTLCAVLLCGGLSAHAGQAHAQDSGTLPAARKAAQPAPAQDNGPIIPDAEFDAAIPPIDTNLGAPLGTVGQWQDQTNGPRPATGATPPPPPSPATATAGETLPPPPAVDPAVEEPLVPLDQFDVRPFDEKSYTEADDSRRVDTRYRYRIEGLDRLDGASAVAPVTPGDIRNRFADLSALEEGHGKAANGAMINARLQEDQKLLADVLSGQGYFDSQVHGSLALPQEGSRDPIDVILDVTPGPRYVLGAISFDAPPVTPPDLIRRSFVPKAGEPIVADRILAAEAAIAVALPENGYPFAKLGQRDILLDAATRTGDYTLPVTPGPRSRFGDILSGGARQVFQPDHIAKIARFKKGELYDSRKVDDLRRALVATGLLSTVAVDPQPSGVAAGDDTQYATLVVTQQAGPARTLAGQAGYATGQGIKLQGSWTHANLFPPEGALILGATAGTQEQGVDATFRRSNAGRRDRSVEFGVDALRSDVEAYEALTGRLHGTVSYLSTPIWQKRWTYSYGFEVLASREQDYDFTAGERRKRTFYLAALPGQVTFDTSNSLLDPTTGFRLSAKLSPEVSLGSGTQTYVRSVFEASGYYPVAGSVVLAGRARVGMIGGAAREQIAPSRRFYGGGGGSVRGFGYQELGPKDPDARPIGGRSLVEASGEVRYRFGNFGIVGFIDGGQVYTSELPRFTDWRFGVGIGGRFYTNFGPMRLDVATPLARKPGESQIAVYVSIGQAF